MTTLVCLATLLIGVPAGVRCAFGLWAVLHCHRSNLPYSVAKYLR